MTEFDPQTKLLHHPEQLTAFLAEEDAPPVHVEISPTNSCNAVCPWCFYISSTYKQHHSQEELDVGLLSAALRDMAEMNVKAVSWTGGGDPSTYSAIDDVIDLVHGLGLRQGIFTNAYKPLRSPEKLDWIRVTVTEKFLITKHVAAYAKATKTGVNFNLCQANAEHLPRMVREARDAGVHYFQVRPALADRWELQEEVECPLWLTDLETPDFRVVLTDYKWADYRKPHGYPICHGHRFVPFLWHNGDVAVCAYHFGKPEYIFGNVKDGGFKAVWDGKRRKGMLQIGIDVIPACQHNCKLHEINKQLATLRGEYIEVTDKDFL